GFDCSGAGGGIGGGTGLAGWNYIPSGYPCGEQNECFNGGDGGNGGYGGTGGDIVIKTTGSGGTISFTGAYLRTNGGDGGWGGRGGLLDAFIPQQLEGGCCEGGGGNGLAGGGGGSILIQATSGTVTLTNTAYYADGG